MEDLINLIFNNGIGVVCVAFMIYFINTTLKDNNKILDEIQKTLISIQMNLSSLSDRISEIERKEKEK